MLASSSSCCSASSTSRRLIFTRRSFASPSGGPQRSFTPRDVAFPSCAPVPARSVLRVSGSDAQRFLNGLAAVRIPDLTEESRAFYAAFLHAQGRLLHDTFIYPHLASRSYLIDHPSALSLPSTAPPLLTHLKRFVLRSKVGVRDVSDEWTTWAAWGHEGASEGEWGGRRSWKWALGGSAELGWEREPAGWKGGEGEVGGWDTRAEGMGWRGLVRPGLTPSVLQPHSAPLASEAYTAHRLAHGVPEGPSELVPLSALPSESNLDFMGGVDFRKGCYVGQELTVRTYHTGQTRKRLVPVELTPLSSLAAAAAGEGGEANKGDDGEVDWERGVGGLNVQLVYHPSPPPSSTTSTAEQQAHPTSTTSISTSSAAAAVEASPSNGPSTAPPRRPTRPKAAGKLLTYDPVSGQGLALLRLGDVDVALKDEGSLEVALPERRRASLEGAAAEGAEHAEEGVKSGGGGEGGGGGGKWAVKVRMDKVGWWPVRPPTGAPAPAAPV